MLCSLFALPSITWCCPSSLPFSAQFYTVTCGGPSSIPPVHLHSGVWRFFFFAAWFRKTKESAIDFAFFRPQRWEHEAGFANLGLVWLQFWVRFGCNVHRHFVSYGTIFMVCALLPCSTLRLLGPSLLKQGSAPCKKAGINKPYTLTYFSECCRARPCLYFFHAGQTQLFFPDIFRAQC